MSENQVKQAGDVPANVWEVAVVSETPLFRLGLGVVLGRTAQFRVGLEGACLRRLLGGGQFGAVRGLIVELDPGHGEVLDALSRLRGLHPEVRAVAISPSRDVEFAERCLRSGATGFVHRSAGEVEIVEALTHVRDGRMFISPLLAGPMIERQLRRTKPRRDAGADPIASLSDREYQVFQLIAAGQSCRIMARELGISVKTVEAHREHIQNKLGLQGCRALAGFARSQILDGTAHSDRSG